MSAAVPERPKEVPDLELLLVRHGESEWNAAGRWQGHGDPPLSARGRAQAEALARELAPVAVTHLFCSDLVRAQQTAAPLAAAWRLEARVRPALRELDVGAWTGLTRAQIAQAAPDTLARFEAGDPKLRPGGGESRVALRTRVRADVERLLREIGRGQPPPDGPIVIVTHRGVIRALWPGTDAENARAYRARWSLLRAAQEREASEESREPGHDRGQ